MVAKIQEILRGVMLRALMVVDISLLMLSFALAAVLTINGEHWPDFGSFFATRVTLLSCVLFAIALFMGHGILVMCNLYQSKRLSTKGAEAVDVLGAMTLLTLCLWCEAKLFRVPGKTMTFLMAFWAVGTALIIVTRVLLRFVLGSIRKRGGNLHHVLILGTNARAVDFARKIESMPDRGCRLLGFVDNDWIGMHVFEQSGFRLACDLEGLPDFLRRNVVDEIAIYLPLRSFYETAAEIAQLARLHGILIRLDTDIFDLKLGCHSADATGDVPHVIVSSNSIDGWQLLMKRTFDIVGSLILLILLSPLFLVVALLIKVTSPGDIFFSQKRVGLNKRQFTMHKFRTMVPTAESMQEKLTHLNEMRGPVFKIRDDPRVTPLGRILRKTSIDELPQLFNVLKGDMSLVGPRAMSVRDYQFFSEDWQRRRFSVPPGITCLWQVYGRNTIPFDQWMVLDMQYIDHWSFWLDIKILALTIPAVFRGYGAG
jgi:exopolysaccharide biosynthesis polyprenyl glycosylphosphotransferase